MRKLLGVTFSLLMVIMFLGQDAMSSHIMGGDMEFECLGNDQYEVEMKLQYDCRSSFSARDPKTIYWSSVDPNCTDNGQQNIPIVEQEEITPICNQQCSACDAGCSFNIGVEDVVYRTTIDMSGAPCDEYEFDIGSECCRNSAIDNSIENRYSFPNTLNLDSAPCPSTPEFGRPPMAIVCKDDTFNYNQAVQPPDEDDSIAFSLVPPRDGNGNDVAFTPPYSHDMPLSVDTSYGFNLDPQTGDLSFIPDQQMTAIMAIQVDQFRNGQQVSEITREIQLDVIQCYNSPPSLNVPADNTVCANDSISIPVTATDPDSQDVHLKWDQSIDDATFDTVSANASVTQDFEWLPYDDDVGSQSFTVEARAENCPVNRRNSQAITVDVEATPDPQIQGPSTVCEHDTYQYSVDDKSDHGYNWSVTGGSITQDNGHEVTVQWANSGSGTVEVSKTNLSSSANCYTTVNKDVTIQPKPATDITGPDTVCDSFGNHSYSVDSLAGNSYDWNVTGGNINGGQGTSSINVSWTSSDSGEVEVTQTIDSTGCDSTTSKPVDIYPKPTPAISGPNTVCEYSSGHDYFVDSISGNNYSWNVTGGNVTEGQGTPSISVKWSNSGVGEIEVTQEIDSTGCDSTASEVVDIHSRPTPDISGPDPVCEYSSGSTYSVDSISDNSYDWHVTGGDITEGQGTSSITVSWSNSDSGEVELTQTVDSTGCDTSTHKAVLIRSNPTPGISGPDSVFEYTSNHSYTVDSNAGNSYSWNVTGGNIIGGQGTDSIIVEWLISGSGQVEVTQTVDSTGCDSTVSLPVSIQPIPIQSISGSDPVCEYSTNHTYLVDSSQAGSNYSWEVIGGNLIAGQGTTSINVEWLSSGTGEVKVTQSNDSTGLDSTVSKTVDINPKPGPDISGPNTVCEYSSGQSYSVSSASDHSYDWEVTGGTITGGKGTSSISVHWLSSGQGEVTVTQTIDSSGCDSTVSKPVNIQSKPTPEISSPDPVCEYSSGHSYSVSSEPGNSYNWKVTGGDITGGHGTSSISVHWSNSGSGEVEVTQTIDSTGCDSTISKAVEIQPTPTPEVSGPDPVCENSSGHSYSVDSLAGNNYDWNVTGGDISGGQGTSSIGVQWSSSGTGEVELTQTIDSTGCDSTISKEVEIQPKPTPAITGSDPVCEYSSDHGYSVDSLAGNSYSWDVSGGSITGGEGTSSISVHWPRSGQGEVEVTQTIDSTGCDSTISKSVEVQPKATPDISGPDPVCEYSSGHSYSVSSASGHSYDWEVTGGTITGGKGASSISVHWLSSGQGEVTVTQTIDSSGCDSTVSKPVNIQSKPTPEISGPDPVCEYSSGHSYSVSSEPGNSYNWKVTGGDITGGHGTSSISVHWSNSGSGEVEVTQTIDSTGCDSTISKSVNIQSKPTPTISGPDPVCEYSSGHSYSVDSLEVNSYDWNVTGGKITGGQSTSSISVHWSSSGHGEVEVTQTVDSTGCDSTISKSVDIQPKPTPKISGPDTVCEYNSDFSYSVPSLSVNSYDWSVEEGHITEGQGNSAIKVHWLSSGNREVEVTQTIDSSGCDSTITKSVEVLPKPTFDISGPEAVCEYDRDVSYEVPSLPGNSYNWNVKGGDITGGQGTSSISVHWSGSGIGAIELTQMIDSTGCDSTISKVVDVRPKPTPKISGPDKICEYTIDVEYTVSSSPGNSYNWDVSGGSITSGEGTSSIKVHWSSAGFGEVEVTQTIDSSGCDSTISRPVEVWPKPKPDISGPEAVCEYTDQHTFSVDHEDGHSYNWTSEEGNITSEANSNEVTVSYIGTSSGADEITLTQQDKTTGCDSTVTHEVTINKKTEPEIKGPSIVCEESRPHTFSSPEANGYSYDWHSERGEVVSGENSNEITLSYLHTTEGGDEITLTQTNEATGCDSTVSMEVTIEPRPEPEISGPSKVCENVDHYVYSVNEAPHHAYYWNINGGDILKGQGEHEVKVSWGESGDGSISVTVADNSTALNCERPVSQKVEIQKAPGITLDHEANGPYCYDEIGSLKGVEVEPSEGSGFWSGPGVSEDTLFYASRAGRGDHSLSYHHTLENGCKDSIITEVTVAKNPADVEMYNVSVEKGFKSVKIDWLASDEALIEEYDVVRYEAGAGMTTVGTASGRENTSYVDDIDLWDYDGDELCYYVVARNSCGEKSELSRPACPVIPETSSDTMVNSVEWSPFEGWDKKVETQAIGKIRDDQGVIEASGMPGDTSYYQDHLDESNTQESYCYYIESTSEDGRLSRSALNCTEQPAIVHMPNSFSPHVTPGINETIGPEGLFIDNFELTIYNRWGGKVYETNDGRYWDGRNESGEKVVSGVYLYDLVVYGHDGSRTVKSGTIHLVR